MASRGLDAQVHQVVAEGVGTSAWDGGLISATAWMGHPHPALGTTQMDIKISNASVVGAGSAFGSGGMVSLQSRPATTHWATIDLSDSTVSRCTAPGGSGGCIALVKSQHSIW